MEANKLFLSLLVFSILILFSLLSTTTVIADDADDSAAMAKLAGTITPTPPNWSMGSSDYCQWQGVQCESNNHVSGVNLGSMSLTVIPSEFPPLPQLKMLNLSHNSLSGSFPSLAHLTSLEALFLQNNNFNDIIPSGFFADIATTLQILILSDNPVLPSWTIPTELTRFPDLQQFYCDRANLTGHIPDMFQSLPNLQKLSLSQNNLSGPLPDSFSLQATIQYMWLHDQMLSGSIHVLSTMTNLVQVEIYGNQFTGPIPDFSNCISLEVIRFDNNLLTGVVPSSQLASLSSLSLRSVNLTSNKLQGPFPILLQMINSSYLDDNNFCTDTGMACDLQVTTLLKIAADLGYPLELSDAWTGNDACSNWRFIRCVSDDNSITSIDFGMQHFGGTISPAFAYLPTLQYLHLNDNNLTGSIPDDLKKLPQLLLLDVSNNNLSGILPFFDSSVTLNISGNPLLISGKSYGYVRTRSMTTIAILTAIVGAIIVVIGAFLLGKCIANYEARKKRREGLLNREESLPKLSRHNVLRIRKNKSILGLQELQLLSFEKLLMATNKFDSTNKLGQGGFGPVYKGLFPDGQEIAVKRLSRASEQGLEEFMNEVELISKIRHRNLVKLLGCCTEGEEKMLVYEYLPNKSLDYLMFDPQKQPLLDWKKCFNIIEGIGRGLLYLHRDSGLRVIHRDLKASNILLDEDLNPKISDFGMARMFGSNEDQANTQRVVGTYGYMSPEYAMEGKFSEKSDVYSFGVLLLEIISGRKNTSFYNDKHASSLIDHAWRLWNEENIWALVDSRICESCFRLEILKCIHIGMLCVQNFMEDRPNMATVVSMLSSEIENLPSPKQTAFVERKIAMDNSLLTKNQCSINYNTGKGTRGLRVKRTAVDSITSAKSINDSEAIISSGGVFKLGFFSLANSTNRYVGIWYNLIPIQTIIWVANKNNPLRDSSGILMISNDGNLVLLNGNKEIVWSTSNDTNPTSSNTSAQLLDSGNLVLLDNTTGTSIWESFEHPSNTFMPTLTVSTNIKTGKKIQLRSWKSSSDPSDGNFSVGLDPLNIPEVFIWNNDLPYWRSGPWNGRVLIGVAIMYSVYLDGLTLIDDKEGTTYITFAFANQSIVAYAVLESQGKLTQRNWDSNKGEWRTVWSLPETECDIYGQCGAFGSCDYSLRPSICSCLRGFEPKNLEEWNKGNWSSGCVRSKPLQCERVSNNGSEVDKADGFLKLGRMKVPDFAEWSAVLEENTCKDLCLSNCSCIAYAYDAGIGCMSWSGNLIDIQKFSNGGKDLYIRVAHSELARKEKGKEQLLINKEKAHPKGDIHGDNINQTNFQELPVFGFEELATATDNFHETNKLGQGGFGPVYKGKLQNGSEIAVKRLSRASGQGLEEFMNEVVVISKLQHRNLVRLLGCCVEGDEKMLVYEYMPNKSLDALLFDIDPLKEEVLDWRKRFNIIEGISRGLLYLHRDSRLRIIHRDLKASNILLDEELNPKISDFGMARIFGGNENQANTTRVVGTYGYMPPEYAMEGRFSEKSDVFSYGVLLLEIVSGRRNTSFYGHEHSISLLAYLCQAANRIAQGETLKDGETLVSEGDIFELGFFSPDNSTSRFVGIWYRVDVKAVVWVANRENPISDRNGVLSIGIDGNLVILDGNNSPVWSSNVSNLPNNTAAKLLDTGNFVLSSNESIDDTSNANWQSFNNPTDTFLPGMRIPVNPAIGEHRSFRSWKSANDPSIGNYTVGIDPTGGPQVVIWDHNKRRWRSGQWNGVYFTGVPNMSSLASFLYGFKLSRPDENRTQYFTYDPSNPSDLLRFRMDWDGSERQMKWEAGEKRWRVLLSQPEPSNQCEIYNHCGNYATCDNSSQMCSCLEGFIPKFQDQWTNKIWSGGCQRRTELECQRNNGTDGFKGLKCMKLPDLATLLTNDEAGDIDECKTSCLGNCSCKAYAFIPGIGCMIWNGDLVDIPHLEEGGNLQFFLRLHPSELGGGRKISNVVIIIIAVVAACILAVSLWLVWRYKKKIKALPAVSSMPCCKDEDVEVVDVSKKVKELSAELSGPYEILRDANQNGPELPVFSFKSVAVATKDFCESNRLGQGGFGAVYKGVLPEGQEVAVKRLSGQSGQGLEEFKTELILIAKLQHRNLVRLLGCSIHGEEKMLLYEYMPNKSLDNFLFDEAKRAELDWKTRLNIIEGIARGLLYLHRDSRLRIIHRDLKASNILLDAEMNPKISDFGMARIFGGNQNEANTVRVVGTYGYMAPEYAMEGLFSVKSDVYSFGVLLLEIVSGRRNTSFRSTTEHTSLIGYAWSLWNENKAMELVDPCIQDSCSPSQMLKCIHIAMLCVQDSAMHRPTMAVVALMLESEAPSLPMVRQPTYTSMRSSIDTEFILEAQEIASSNDVTVTMVVGR
ncbi:hypothetical protein CCACVL1_15527 [Corchorus capsularis]|uniref:non-specific serine/threonine protein kinase n=1 Tax=Corchorus capsularis TaxID=210143 RepID=A0A1R3I214_COCAP|nr:hypothetical protein CCACVL1_15527 [Corchorus capsularis]